MRVNRADPYTAPETHLAQSEGWRREVNSSPTMQTRGPAPEEASTLVNVTLLLCVRAGIKTKATLSPVLIPFAVTLSVSPIFVKEAKILNQIKIPLLSALTVVTAQFEETRNRGRCIPRSFRRQKSTELGAVVGET